MAETGNSEGEKDLKPGLYEKTYTAFDASKISPITLDKISKKTGAEIEIDGDGPKGFIGRIKRLVVIPQRKKK